MTDNLPEALRRQANRLERYGHQTAPLTMREAADTIDGLTAMVNAPDTATAGRVVEWIRALPACGPLAAYENHLCDAIEREFGCRVPTARPDMAGEGKLNGLADEPSLTMIYGAIMALRDEVRRR